MNATPRRVDCPLPPAPRRHQDPRAIQRDQATHRDKKSRIAQLLSDGHPIFCEMPAAYDLRMFPRTSGRLIPFIVLLACSAALLCLAQQAQPSEPAELRYHFGDDPDGKLGWADPKNDNSARTSQKTANGRGRPSTRAAFFGFAFTSGSGATLQARSPSAARRPFSLLWKPQLTRGKSMRVAYWQADRAAFRPRSTWTLTKGMLSSTCRRPRRHREQQP